MPLCRWLLEELNRIDIFGTRLQQRRQPVHLVLDGQVLTETRMAFALCSVSADPLAADSM